MKKKILSVFLVVAMVASMIPAFGMVASATDTTEEAIDPNRDESWYSDDATSFTIRTAAQLLGFSDLLASGTTFAGKTVKLDADIDLNPNWTANATAPANKWADVTAKHFGGTFDGGGHRISGIYLSSAAESAGIFGIADDGAELKDLVIDNSYVSIYKTSGALFAWMTAGTVNITNVYCDVDVTASNQYCGGFMGRLYGGTLNISNCVYAGDFVSTHSGRNYDGGFVGSIAHSSYSGGDKGNAVLNISNSAFYGTIKAKEFGGIVGEVGSSGYGVLNATSCIVAGDIDNLGYTCGSFYAKAIDGKNYITLTNCYYTELLDYDTVEYQAYPEGQPAPAEGSKLIQIADEELKALDAAALTEKKLGVWVARENAYPLPMTVEALLRGEVLELSPLPEDHWYTKELTDGTQNLFVIDSTEDMLAFSEALEVGVTFEDCTVELAADIDLNEGWSADVKTVSTPKNVWKLTTGGKNFSGAFDGKGHTVSGVYIKSVASDTDDTVCDNIGIFGNATGSAVTVKNIVITNSYVESEGGSVGGLFGGVDGSLTLDGVYLDVNILNEGREYKSGLGGFIGTVGAGSAVTLANSVFAGKITTTQAKQAGGIYGIGGFIGTADATAQTDATKKADTSISATDCGMFGILNCTSNFAGGFIGIAGHQQSAEEQDEVVGISLDRVIIAGSLYTKYPSFNGSVCGHLMTAPENLTARSCYHIAYRDGNELSERVVYISSNNAEGLEGFTLVSDMSIRGADVGAWLTAQALSEWTATVGYPMPTAIVDILNAHKLPGLGDIPNDMLPPSGDTNNDGNSGNHENDGNDGNDGSGMGDGDETGSDITNEPVGEKTLLDDIMDVLATVAEVCGVSVPVLIGITLGVIVLIVLCDVAATAAVAIPVSVITLAIDRKRRGVIESTSSASKVTKSNPKATPSDPKATPSDPKATPSDTKENPSEP